MFKNIKSNLIYLLTFFIFLISIFLTAQIYLYFHDSLLFSVNTIYGIMCYALIVLTYYIILKNTKNIPVSFISFFLISGSLLSFVSFFIIIGLSSHKIKLIEPNYIGSYVTLMDSETGNDQKHRTFVFEVNDNRIEEEIEALESEYDDYNQNEYLFWQTAYIEGYEADYISGFSSPKTLIERFVLFFKLGPFFILEKIINSIIISLVLMLFPIIALFFNVKIFGKKLKPLEDLFKKETIKNNQIKKSELQIDASINFIKGRKYFFESDWTNALYYLDKAVENGYMKDGIFEIRGFCLQSLDYYFDAIEDFNKAISLSPNDCSLHYNRGLYKGITLDYEGEIKDIEKAIELFKPDTQMNREHNQNAINMGFSSGLLGMYELSLFSALSRLEDDQRENKDYYDEQLIFMKRR